MSLKPTSIPTKTLAASITALSSSFKLNNILGWNGSALTSSDFGTQAYCVFRNASRSRIEIMEFDPATVASTSITILRRGLSFDGDLTTEVTANKFAWTKGDTFVDMGTDAPQVFQWMKEYIDAASIAGAVPASTVAQGIVEEATQAERDALTDTGATGAQLFVPPSKLDREAKTLLPSLFTGPYQVTSQGITTNTTAWTGLVIIPFKITVNSITIYISTATTPGTLDLSMYTEDGQTQLFSVTTATVTANALLTTAVPSVTILPGNYYIMVNGNGTLNVVTYYHYSSTTGYNGTSNSFLGDVTGKRLTRGTLTITADTPPTTFDPTALTDTEYSLIAFRLDN